MPPRTRPAEPLCEMPLCERKGLPALRCGHRFCSACMLGLVKVTHPELAMLVLTCPLCREKCAVEEISFALLMQEHKPNGTLIMDFTETKAGLCLVMQSKAKRKDVVREPRFFFLQTEYYLKYLADAPADDQDMNRLFEELSRRSQTRMDAYGLLADMPSSSPPFPLMTGMFLYLAGMRALSEEAAEQNV